MSRNIHRPLAAGIAALLCSGAVHAVPTVELAVNGGFETGTFAGWTQFPTGPTSNQFISTVNPASGTYAGEINNTVLISNSLFKQANIGIGQVAPGGQTIHVNFDARGSFGIGGVAFAEFFSELSGGGTSKAEILGLNPLAVNADPNVWTHFSFDVTTGPDVSGGVTLQLGATTGGAAGSVAHMWYDNISITVDDADGDGIADAVDNCKALANANQRDTNADGYGNLCDPDLNNDGVVNINDFNRLKSRLGITPVVDVDADLDGNGAVNINDLNRLKSFLGKPPGPSALHPNCPPTCP
jgi:hypothetical protein